MCIFTLFKRGQRGQGTTPEAKPDSRRLFDALNKGFYTKYENGWRREDKGEGMAVLEMLVNDYWKPRYLLDTRAHRAYEIMSEDLSLLLVRDEDIDWDSLKTLSPDLIDTVRSRNAFYPTMIRGFKNGIAELEWQLNPDGRYYMDDDGFGMTDDEEVALYGMIDRTGRLVKKMHLIPWNGVATGSLK